MLGSESCHPWRFIMLRSVVVLLDDVIAIRVDVIMNLLVSIILVYENYQ